ncbi:GNAT family N-acetyltransferase [Pseudooceanicola sp. CBS1P-1]|uniref:GNAT family N-acetyltransferase n=1 Tax=Pseudooceanicola albus TaxID=2692189 RepID=A0A6L7G444_9RHOB|nr:MULTISPECIES: GNAT family N-acetyltransferase [Pseudooceanicola]MBT9384866.1 GNAT family N-acetyltransferase [Pseudooceanicola endophyticus]MXN18140.1 GNAT family N-acetyltransferase [Pseudooceanicola albus]
MEAFLSGHAETSMFLRGNLAAHGIGASEAANATDFWLWEDAGRLAGVFGATRSGNLMLQLPGRAPEALAAAARALKGRPFKALTGEARQAEAFLKVLGQWDGLRVNDLEPLYRLDLSKLPGGASPLRRARSEELPMLSAWFAAYERDLGFAAADPAEARLQAFLRAEEAVSGGSAVRLLTEADRPVAMAALNAEAVDCVQLGGVYVPEGARNAGLGRRVARAVLAEARDRGARTAILFANNPAAARAYEAIGFERIGDYRIAMPQAPTVLGEVPK